MDIDDEISSTKELIEYYEDLGCKLDEDLDECVKVKGDSMFRKPTTKGVVTSYFGYRTHPVTGVYKLHTGVDIGAPMGANFIAANDGVVVKAGYNIAYGNMVIVDHGGGVSTLYAHGSEILVEVGQEVTTGTSILKVGSTGYSTGPHAHFEVRINGEYIDPLEYITSYTTTVSDTTQTAELNIVN